MEWNAFYIESANGCFVMSFRDLEEDPLFVDDFSPENRLSSPDWLSNSPTHSPYHAKPDGKTEVHKIVNRYTVFPRKHVPCYTF